MSTRRALGRPRVIVSSTASLDGRITFSRPERLLNPGVGQRWQSHWPPDVPELMARRTADIEDRYHPTVVMEGSGTFVADDAAPVPGIPGQHDPSALRQDWLPRRSPKWFVVVDSRGRVPWSFTGDGDTALLVLVCARTPVPYLAWLRELEVPYLVAGEGRVDLSVAMEKLPGLLGATCVVSGGGGGINGALLRAGLLDEIQMIWFPAVIGGAGTPSAFDGDPLRPGQPPRVMTHRGTVIGRCGSIWSRYESATDLDRPR